MHFHASVETLQGQTSPCQKSEPFVSGGEKNLAIYLWDETKMLLRCGSDRGAVLMSSDSPCVHHGSTYDETLCQLGFCRSRISVMFLEASYVTCRRRTWQHTPVFLPGKSHGQRSLVGLPSMGSQRVGHDWSNQTTIRYSHISAATGFKGTCYTTWVQSHTGSINILVSLQEPLVQWSW